MSTLPEIIADPRLLNGLPPETLLDLRRQVRHFAIEVDEAIDRLARSADRLAGTEFTVEQVAQRINRPVGYVRDLLRRGDLRGFRRGKYWMIRGEDLARRVDTTSSVTLPSKHDDTGGASTAQKAARPYTVAVRRPDRGACRERQEVGDGRHGDAADNGAADPATHEGQGG